MREGNVPIDAVIIGRRAHGIITERDIPQAPEPQETTAEAAMTREVLTMTPRSRYGVRQACMPIEKSAAYRCSIKARWSSVERYQLQTQLVVIRVAF